MPGFEFGKYLQNSLNFVENVIGMCLFFIRGISQEDALGNSVMNGYRGGVGFQDGIFKGQKEGGFSS